MLGNESGSSHVGARDPATRAIMCFQDLHLQEAALELTPRHLIQDGSFSHGILAIVPDVHPSQSPCKTHSQPVIMKQIILLYRILLWGIAEALVRLFWVTSSWWSCYLLGNKMLPFVEHLLCGRSLDSEATSSFRICDSLCPRQDRTVKPALWFWELNETMPSCLINC